MHGETSCLPGSRHGHAAEPFDEEDEIGAQRPGIGRKEPCNDHAVKGADAALATRSFEGKARPIQARLCIGRDVEEGCERARAVPRGPPRQDGVDIAFEPHVLGEDKAIRPNTVLSTSVRDASAAISTSRRRRSKAPSKRICSWGNQASREAGPSVREISISLALPSER